MQTGPGISDRGIKTPTEKAAAVAEIERRRRALRRAFAHMGLSHGPAAPTGAATRTSYTKAESRGAVPGRRGHAKGDAVQPPEERLDVWAGASAASVAGAAPVGQATFSRGGRPVMLSANSRRLPPAFTEQRRTAQLIERSVANVNDTLRKLTHDLSRATDIQLPPETIAAVEENHRAFTDSLALRTGRASSTAATDGMSANGFFLPYRLRGKKLHADWLVKLRRARAAAADETIGGESAVVDYAGDAEVPRLAKDRSLQDELEAMHESLEEIVTGARAMRVDISGDLRDWHIPGLDSNPRAAEAESATSAVAATNGIGGGSAAAAGGKAEGSAAVASGGGGGASAVPWWASALRTRDLKAHAIRLNYHARRALLWDWRCREHALLQAALLNHSAHKCREDLVKLQAQLASFSQRFTESEEMTHAMQSEMATLQQELVEVSQVRGERQDAIVALAHAEGLIAESDVEPQNAELALLLSRHVWPAELADDVAQVLQWVRTEQVTLE